MKRKSRIFAIVLIALGMVMMLASLVSCGFNFKKLDENSNNNSSYDIKENINNISIISKTADIMILPSDTEYVKVVCEKEENKCTHNVTVENGTLLIEYNDERKWYEYIQVFSYEDSMVYVYLPAGEYSQLSIKSDTSDVKVASDFSFKSIDVSLDTGDTEIYASATDFVHVKASTGDVKLDGINTGDIKVNTSTGDMSFGNCNANTLSVSSDTGDVSVSSVTLSGAFNQKVTTGKTQISDMTCQSFTTNGDSGSISMTNLVASGIVSIERSTGKVNLTGCDAGEFAIETSTGDVKASLLTEKIFIIRTNTGKINVPETLTGGKCKIVTNTGDITVNIVQ